MCTSRFCFAAALLATVSFVSYAPAQVRAKAKAKAEVRDEIRDERRDDRKEVIREDEEVVREEHAARVGTGGVGLRAAGVDQREEQRVIHHDDVGSLGLHPRAIEETPVAKRRSANRLQAVVGRR